MTTTTRTFCRLCEVGCGLVAHVDDDGALVELRPDHDHPVTHGFACSNGLVAAEVHRDPARLRHPQRRADAGGGNGAASGAAFVDITWDEATEEIAARLRALVDEHGPRAVGLYLGNPNAFNAMAGAGSIQFIRTLGSDRVFSSASQDCSNKYATAELLYGVPQANPIADLDCTELLVVIGANPRVSKTSFLSVADPVRALRDIRDRGGSVVFVNPLRIEPAIGETLQVRPDTDPYLLAAMLHEIDRTTGFTLGALDGDVVGVDDVRAFVRPYSPAAVAPVVGIPAEQIAELAHSFATANGASIHVSTGLNMGRQGALGYWLAQMLSLLTGNLDRPGGNYFAGRGLPIAPTPVDRTESSFVETKWGAYRPTVGMMPAALLADLIDDDEEPLRGPDRRGREPRTLDRWERPPAGRAAFARPAGDHRPVPQRDRRAGRLRAPGHRPVRARRPQHLRAGRAEDALRAVDGQGHRARGRAARGVALPGRAPRRRRSTGGPRRLAHRSAAAHLRRRALELWV